MGELDQPPVGKESRDVQQSAEGSPLWIVVIMILMIVGLIVWYRFK
jgi:hypothetical protein